MFSFFFFFFQAAESFKSKPLIINDLDFSEFHKDEFEQDPLVMARLAAIAQEKGLLPGVSTSGIPPGNNYHILV